MKILLAEDDHHVAMIAQICLEKIGGHQVCVSLDGESALRAALTMQFDLILLDGMMPKRSGLQVAEAYLAQHPAPAPIIFLSAKSDEVEIKKFMGLAAGYIAKPFDPQSICTQIEEILIHWKTKAS